VAKCSAVALPAAQATAPATLAAGTSSGTCAAPPRTQQQQRRQARQGSSGCPHLVNRGPALQEWVDRAQAEPLDVEVCVCVEGVSGVSRMMGSRCCGLAGWLCMRLELHAAGSHQGTLTSLPP
jgi:hypothetical protein